MNIVEPINTYFNGVVNSKSNKTSNLAFKAGSQKLANALFNIAKQNGIKILSGLLSLYTLFEISQLINIKEMSSLDKIRKNKTNRQIQDSTPNGTTSGAAAPPSHSCKSVKTEKHKTWEDFLDEAEESEKTVHDKTIAETKNKYLLIETIDNEHNSLACDTNQNRPFESMPTFEDWIDRTLESRENIIV